MNKRILSLALAMAMIVLLFSGCKDNSNTDEHRLITQTTTAVIKDTGSFKLSYSQSDSLDPFKSKTLNNQVLEDLVFDSLFTMDENYEPQPQIAGSYAYTDSKTLSVTIPRGTLFSNGDEVTAQSVVNSFNEAQLSPHWRNSLKAIESAREGDNNSVIFSLSYPNPNAHNLLTFAIASSKTDKNGMAVGSGRYKYSVDDGQLKLVVNKHYPDFSPRFTKIPLVNVATEESVDNAVNIGNISFAYRDLSSGNNVRLQCNKKLINLNNLVYIGLNNYSASIVSNANIRRAISLAIDRDTLVKSSYQGCAHSATSVFNPVSRLGKSTKVFGSAADPVAAKQAVAQSGYPKEKLKLTLLVNKNKNRVSAAKLIKQELEAVGFEVTINTEKDKAYKKGVKKRNFDIYIGETAVTNDMNLYSFFKKNGATAYGIDTKNSKAASAYKKYMNGKGEIGNFVIAFSEELPFIPVLYRQGMICYSKSIRGDMQGYHGNYFSNIEDWYCNQ